MPLFGPGIGPNGPSATTSSMTTHADQAEPEKRRAHDAGVAAERAYLANLRLNLVFAGEC